MDVFINENVGLFYAKDKFENILLINEITENNKDIDLTCPICGTTVKPRALGSDKVSPHFYHLTATEHSSESVLHWWYKNKYLVTGDEFCIVVDGKKINHKCLYVDIEKWYSTSVGRYKPDVMITTDSGEEIFFECNYTNKKNSDDYAEKWIELDKTVVELNINDLITKKEKIFRPIFFDGVVMCKSRSERYNVFDRHIKEGKITDRTRIKYLNGFLRDALRYNNKEINIETLALIIDHMNEYDKIALPKLLKNIRCNSILESYSKYKVNEVKQILKDVLCEKGLSYTDYEWIVESTYSLKWTKSRGARFNNTIVVKRYEYSRYYNYNRCKYNDVSSGFDILFIDYNVIKNDIILSIDNELKRISDIQKDKIKQHVHSQRVHSENVINNFCHSICGSDYQIKINKVEHKEYPCINTYLNVMTEIQKYRGVGRYNKIKDIIETGCSSLDVGKISFLKTLDDVSVKIDDICDYCKELLNFSVEVVFPNNKTSLYPNTTVKIWKMDSYLLFSIDLYEISHQNNNITSFELISLLKKEILFKFNESNNIKTLVDGTSFIYCNKSIEHDVKFDENLNNVCITFSKRNKPLKCEIMVFDNTFTLKYIDKTYKCLLRNYYEGYELIRYVCNKLY